MEELCKNGGNFLELVECLVKEVNHICQQYFKFLKFVYGPPCPRKTCPGARVDIHAVQRPCDSSSSDSEESKDETEKESKPNAPQSPGNRTAGRRVHVLNMNKFQPPYWCHRVEIVEDDLKDWKPTLTIELDESCAAIDTTDGSKCVVVNCCCLELIVDSIGGDEWKLIGRKLGVDEAKLDNILKEEDKQTERCHRVFLMWQRRFGKKATIEKLTNALQLIERQDLAEQLQKHVHSHENRIS